MSNGRFRTIDQFRTECLVGSAGPLASAVEDMADEMYKVEVVEEVESMWDSHEDEDE